MRRLSLGLVVAVLAVACGGGGTPTDPGAVGVSPDDLACDERVSFHGDPVEGFVGEDTPEEAIAGAPAEWGTPTRASEDGSLWVVFDDQGHLVGRIEVVAAPGGGFMTGEVELCAEADAEGETRRAQEEEEAATNTWFLLVVLRPDTPFAQAESVAEAARAIPGVFGDSYEEGMGLDGAFESLDADIQRDRPELSDCLYPTRVIVVLSDSDTTQAVVDAVGELPGVLGFVGEGLDLSRSLDELTESCGKSGTGSGRMVQVVFASEDQSDCSNVTVFDRTIDESDQPIQAAFQLLVAGPTAEESNEGASSFFSQETADMLLSVDLDNGVLTVNFADLRSILNNASTSCGSESLIAQLNGTAFQFPAVERVSYQIEGSCDTFQGWLQRNDCQQYSRP